MHSGMRRTRLRTLRLAGWLLLGIAWVPSARAYDWSVGGALFYQTGDYGTDISSDLVYIPFTARRHFSRGDAAVTVPYLWLRSDRNPLTGESGSTTESGLGDIALKGRYQAVSQESWKPFIDVFGRVKLPTADEDKGLGTGETDFGIGTEMVRRFAGPYLAFFDISYTWVGSPSGVDYDNRVVWDIGIGYEMRPNMLLSVFYEHRTSITAIGKDSRSIYGLVNWLVRRDLSVYGMLETGVSDGGPDFGVSAGITRKL